MPPRKVADQFQARRYYLHPFVDEEAWKLYKQQQNSYWTAEEVASEITKDKVQFDAMTPEMQRFVRYVLSFFLVADGLVMSLLQSMPPAPTMESTAFFGIQGAIEAVHLEVYSEWASTLCPAQHSQELHAVIASSKAIQRKRDFILSFAGGDVDPSVQVVGLALSEGVNFASVFAAFFFLRTKNIMPGLTLSNQLIFRDESLHMRHACHIYRKHFKRLPRERVLVLVRAAVDAEKEFVKESVM